jgi:hypothetical protein
MNYNGLVAMLFYGEIEKKKNVRYIKKMERDTFRGA